jgi:hypothetical protein
MTYANPHYDPEWKTVHDHHAAERARVEAEQDRLARAGAMLSDAYKQAKAEFDRHHQTCLAAIKAQHVTVQDYAAWLFREFDVSTVDWEGAIPVPVVDFEELRTIEEADRAWSRVRQIVSDSASERRNSLPTGQPEDLRAFADAASPSLTRYWREFSPRELYPSGYYAGDSGTRTLVTADEQDDGWHVCFMQDANNVGVSVTNAIERLATAVYREACALAEQQASASGGVRGWLARRRAGRARAAMPVPERFHFYQHLPPRGGSLLGEQFDRVDLAFRDGRYRDPEWAAYPVVPAAIQSARFDCALDASVSGIQPHCPLIGDQRVAEDEP